jgi:hypothetical protein
LHVTPDVLSPAVRAAVTTELNTCGLFRTYPVQGTKEPRAHFLLHHAATDDDWDDVVPQPGYRYRGGATMKARPLRRLPHVHQLVNRLAVVARSWQDDDNGNNDDDDDDDDDNEMDDDRVSTYWNIGVNPVLYRNGRDKMGYHADDDQDETVIFTVLAYSPYPRRIVIKKTKSERDDSDNDDCERYELFLREGGGYCMDGVMQQSYLHGVPAVAKQPYGHWPRLAIVLRRGRPGWYQRDSGQVLSDLAPREPTPPRPFGHLPGLCEGHLYTMSQLVHELRAHGLQQVGVSGNQREGCDSIVVARSPTTDTLFAFDYVAQPQHGGYRLDTSVRSGQPVRVLRSSKAAGSVFRPPKRPKKPQQHHQSTESYRYDGLYYATFVNERTIQEPNGDQSVKDVVYRMYRMVRAGQGCGPGENRIDNAIYMQYCIYRGTMLAEAAVGAKEVAQEPAATNEGKTRKATWMQVAQQERTAKGTRVAATPPTTIITPPRQHKRKNRDDPTTSTKPSTTANSTAKPHGNHDGNVSIVSANDSDNVVSSLGTPKRRRTVRTAFDDVVEVDAAAVSPQQCPGLPTNISSTNKRKLSSSTSSINTINAASDNAIGQSVGPIGSSSHYHSSYGEAAAAATLLMSMESFVAHCRAARNIAAKIRAQRRRRAVRLTHKNFGGDGWGFQNRSTKPPDSG